MTKPFYEVRKVKDLRDLLDQSIALYPNRYAFEIKTRTGEHYNITFPEYRRDINAVGTALISLGLKDARIAIAADNCYEWCVSYMAVVNGVGVVVPTDKELHCDDIANILSVSEAKLLFCDEKILGKMKPVLDSLPDNFIFVCYGKDEDDGNVLSYSRLLERGKALLDGGNKDYINAEIDIEKMCTLLFTSGTTGVAKGVMLCQKNFLFEIEATMGVVKITPDDCGISMLPLHHTYENTIILFMACYTGAKVTFCDGFKYVLQNMKEFSPTVFVSVPLILETVHRRILKAIKAKSHGEIKFKVGKALCKIGQPLGLDLKRKFFGEIQDTFGGHMRLIICGAAPIAPEILEDFDAFGIQIIFGYGLTECAPLCIINNDKMHSAKSIGVPLPGVEAKIINPDSETGIGEIAVKGDMLMLGYYNNAEATAQVIDSDGFFHTGDLGRVDRRGRFYICGRSKNVIVTQNGKNIFPEELEYHLSRSPLIGECMVVGEPDAKGDLVVKAKIFPNFDEIKAKLGKGEISKADIKEVVRNLIREVNRILPPYKRISDFSIREREFVKTTTAKIKRYDSENEDDED